MTMGRRTTEGLNVKIPSFFRCPISLDVMKSPVSLCTGVTYDRSSIQRWLDSGNNTCPATMQPLPSTDLVPNLTLHRLITLWGAHSPRNHHHLTDLLSNPTPPLIGKLSSFLDDVDVDSSDKNRTIIKSVDLLKSLAKFDVETLESAVALANQVLESDWIDKENRETLLDAIRSDQANLEALISVLREGRPDARGSAASVIRALLEKSEESKLRISESTDQLVPELIALISSGTPGVDAGLRCLLSLSSINKRARVRMARSGIVPVLTRVVAKEGNVVCVETALRLMEVVSGCREGREAVGEEAEGVVREVLGRMVRVGREGREAAVVVLWRLCHLWRDRRAQEELVRAENGGLTKILLVMQSDCSAAVREMAGDLLRVFRVNKKCCLGGYDTKTAHIMPF